MITKAAREVIESTDSNLFSEYDSRFLQKCTDSSLNEAEKRQSIAILCSILKRIHRRNVLILVDEYDHCMQNIHSGAVFDDVVRFLRPFMEQTFKFNTDCEFAVVTGIMPLTKTSMLSSFNNAKVCSILETEGDEYFGDPHPVSTIIYPKTVRQNAPKLFGKMPQNCSAKCPKTVRRKRGDTDELQVQDS